MKEDFNYNEVPRDYLHCLHAQCPRSAHCLRFQVAQHASPTTLFFSVINPAYVMGKEDNCTHFKQDSLSRFAIGITHLFDNIPHAKAVKVKQMLLHHFERNMYYRIRNKERHISPEEQQAISYIFEKEGIKEEPLYDEYIYKYQW